MQKEGGRGVVIQYSKVLTTIYICIGSRSYKLFICDSRGFCGFRDEPCHQLHSSVTQFTVQRPVLELKSYNVHHFDCSSRLHVTGLFFGILNSQRFKHILLLLSGSGPSVFDGKNSVMIYYNYCY